MVEVTNAIGVLVEYNGKILILQREPKNYQGSNWDVPGGRLKSNESPIKAIKRELLEEVGFIANEKMLEYIRMFNWDSNNTSIIFRIFRLRIPELFEVKLNPLEHIEYKWITPEECYTMKNLIHGFHEILEKVYLSKS